MYILISYDIQNDKTRAKVAKILSDYGMRIQFSVFECDISNKQFEELKAKITDLIDHENDRVRFYQICKSCQKTAIISGVAQLYEKNDFMVV